MTKKASQSFIGNVTLETRDAKTGKICQRIQGNNFIGQSNIEYMKWLQRYLYRYLMTGTGGLGITDTDTIAPSGPLNAVYLTDSAQAENPESEYLIPGKLLGWAGKQSVYAGADTLRGTANINLLDAQPTYTKWVFDWPTNAANGTIRSVGWGNLSLTQWVGGSPSQTLVAQNMTVKQVWPTPSRWYFFARASDTLAFGWTSGTNISVLDGSYVQSTTFSVSSQFASVTGIAWDRTHNFLWVIGLYSGASRIAAYNSAGVLQTGPFTPTNRSYKFLAHDGEHLWAGLHTTGTVVTLYRINATNGTDMTNFTTSLLYDYANQRLSGLAWDWSANRLWARIASSASSTTTTYTNSAHLRAFNASGEEQAVYVNLNTYDMTGSGITKPYTDSGNRLVEHDFDVISKDEFAFPTNVNDTTRVLRLKADGLHSRSLLPAPVVKANTQTLRLIYQINYI